MYTLSARLLAAEGQSVSRHTSTEICIALQLTHE